MINDRGSKKWTTMMLPEHGEMLKKLQKEYYLEEKPILDEQHLERLQFLLIKALENDFTIKITYFIDGKYFHEKGKVTFINYFNKTVTINNKTLDSGSILDVAFL